MNIIARLKFSSADLEKARRWARVCQYSYERDKDFSSMLFDAHCAGVIEGEIQEVEEE